MGKFKKSYKNGNEKRKIKEKELLKIQALDPKQQKITFRNGKLRKLIYQYDLCFFFFIDTMHMFKTQLFTDMLLINQVLYITEFYILFSAELALFDLEFLGNNSISISTATNSSPSNDTTLS